MILSTSLIRSICGDLIVADSITREKTYDWVDIVGIPQRPATSGKPRLFFASYSGTSGWTEGFDRRPYAEKVCRENGWDLISDNPICPENSGIQVVSLEKTALRLYGYFRKIHKPIVVGVTGSVGKTTTLSLFEQVVAASGKKVVRFYSKRLTPLSVMCHFLNRVNEDTEIIVMEYSAYHYDHVFQLAQLLPSEIVFVINIYDTHINPGMFKDRTEILRSKMRIKTDWTKKAYVNSSAIRLVSPDELSGWEVFTPQIPQVAPDYLPPTKRTAEMFTVAKLVSDELNISPENVENTLKTFVPEESRIVSVYAGGKKIFFHGETSGGSRLWSWLETYDGSVPYMFVESIDFASEDESGFRNLLEQVFRSNKTFVLDTERNRARLKVPAHFVAYENFVGRLKSAQGYIVYHKALSVRRKGFDPALYLQNLFG